MAIKIEFQADLAEVRAALESLRSEAASKPIKVGVAGAGGVGGGAPTVAGTFASSAAATSNILGTSPNVTPMAARQAASVRANYFDPNGWKALHAGGWQAINSGWQNLNTGGWQAMSPRGGGGGGYQPGPQPGVPGFSQIVPYASPAGNSPKSGHSNSRFAGLGGYVGLAFGATQAAHLGMAYRESVAADVLSGGNPRGQLEAQLGFQKAVGAVPLFGPAASAGADLFATAGGFGSTGTSALLQSSDVQDRQTGAMRQASEAKAKLQSRQNIDAAIEPYQKRMQAVREAYAAERREIKETEKAQSELDMQSLSALRARQDAAAGKRVAKNIMVGLSTAGIPGGIAGAMSGGRSAADDADYASERDRLSRRRGSAASEATAFADKHFAYQEAEIRREEAFGFASEAVRAGGSINASRYEAENQPAAGARERLTSNQRVRKLEGERRRDNPDLIAIRFAEDEAEIDAFDAGVSRDRSMRRIDVGGQIEQAKAKLNRNPLAGLLAGADSVHGQRNLYPNMKPEDKAAELERYGLEVAGIRQAYNDRKELDMMGLRGRGRAINAALRGGLYGGVAGQATSIVEGAKLAAAERAKEDAGSGEAQRQIFQNSISELQLLRKNYFQRFKPTEVDPTTTDLSQERNSDASAILKTIEDLLRECRDSLRDVGKAA